MIFIQLNISIATLNLFLSAPSIPLPHTPSAPPLLLFLVPPFDGQTPPPIKVMPRVWPVLLQDKPCILPRAGLFVLMWTTF